MKRVIAGVLSFAVAAPLMAAEDAPPRPWASSIGAGLAVTSGNTDTKNLNFSFTTKYDPKSRWIFKAEALYLRGESDGEKQVDKASADARGEYSVSKRTFAFAEVSYLRDPFKAITYLVAPVVGAGRHVFKTDAIDLTLDGALGVDFENDTDVGRSSGSVVKAGQNFEWAVSSSSKLTQRITALWKTSDFADSLYHFDAGLTTTVVTRIELKLAYTYDYKNKPPPEIEKGDSALFAAVLFKF